jgi:hypothetical protein
MFFQAAEKLGMVMDITQIVRCLADDTAELIGFTPREIFNFADDQVDVRHGSSCVHHINDLGENRF